MLESLLSSKLMVCIIIVIIIIKLEIAYLAGKVVKHLSSVFKILNFKLLFSDMLVM